MRYDNTKIMISESTGGAKVDLDIFSVNGLDELSDFSSGVQAYSNWSRLT